VFLRGRENFLKRVLIHLGALNLSLVMRQLLGKGTPRSWQGYSANDLVIWLQLWMAVLVRTDQELHQRRGRLIFESCAAGFPHLLQDNLDRLEDTPCKFPAMVAARGRSGSLILHRAGCQNCEQRHH
jgi:hypothetical protein